MFLALLRVHLSKADDLPDGLGVETSALGLGINLFDVGGDCGLLFFHPLNTLDKRLEAFGGDAAYIFCHDYLSFHTVKHVGLAAGRWRKAAASLAQTLDKI